MSTKAKKSYSGTEGSSVPVLIGHVLVSGVMLLCACLALFSTISSSGATSLIISLILLIVFGILGCLIMPPIATSIEKRTGLSLAAPAKNWVCIIFSIIMAVLLMVGEYGAARKEEQEAAIAAERQKKKDEEKQYFYDNAEQIIATIKTQIENKDYEKALTETQKYAIYNDDELNFYRAEAEKKLHAQQKLAQARKDLEMARSVPEEDFMTKSEYYTKVLKAYPKSHALKREARPYLQKARRSKLIKKQFVFDRHTMAEVYIEKMLHDPDSFEHVQTSWYAEGDNHIVVTVKYRAANGFGALRLNRSVLMFNLEGKLVKVLE